MRRPSRIGQLPVATQTMPSDVFIVSQEVEGGRETRQLSQPRLFAEITNEVNSSRAVIVKRFEDRVAAIDLRLDQNEANDATTKAAVMLLQQMVNGESGDTPYDLWLEAGNTGTLEDYLASLRGPAGKDGRDGVDGLNGKDGLNGAEGPRGPSATTEQIAAAVASYSQQNPAPKGDKGDKGDTGPAGPKGDTGSVGPKGDTGATGPAGATGATGPAGTPGNTLVGTVTLSETAVLAISAGVRAVTVQMAGVVPAGNYQLFRTAAGTPNVGILDCACITAGQLDVRLIVPAIVLGGSYSIPVRVVRINT